MTSPAIQPNSPQQHPSSEFSRPLYIKRVPESTWLRVHDNANRSRMRITDYVVQILERSEPVPITAAATAKRAS